VPLYAIVGEAALDPAKVAGFGIADTREAGTPAEIEKAASALALA